MLFVLDLDDTLYLERDYVRSGFIAVDAWVEEKLNKKSFFERAWELFEAGSRGTIFNRVLSDLGLEEDGIVDTLVSVYRSHSPSISLKPDATKFLASAPRQDLAIITDGYSVTQWAKIDALGLKDKVGQIVATGDWGKEFWKPHSRAFNLVSNDHSPKECVYIADNPTKDFIAPEKLGWATSIRIRRPGGLHFDLETPPGCIEASSFDEINDLF